jgi:hypothetical protein
MKVFMLKEEDFADLERRVELHYMKRAEHADQPWNTSFRHDDPRGRSVYDQFKSTWFEVCRWTQEHGA